MRRTPRLLLVPLLWLLGCTSAKPANGTYTIGFPSTAAAVAVDSVQVLVFNLTAPDLCQTLVQDRRTQMPLPGTPVAQTSPQSPCALLSGGSALPIDTFGDFAFLAVAQAGGQDFLVGCAAQTMSATNTNVVIPLELVSNTTVVPTNEAGFWATSCMTLAQKCANQCQ